MTDKVNGFPYVPFENVTGGLDRFIFFTTVNITPETGPGVSYTPTYTPGVFPTYQDTLVMDSEAHLNNLIKAIGTRAMPVISRFAAVADISKVQSFDGTQTAEYGSGTAPASGTAGYVLEFMIEHRGAWDIDQSTQYPGTTAGTPAPQASDLRNDVTSLLNVLVAADSAFTLENSGIIKDGGSVPAV